jgi:hypothetical protein
MMLMKDQGSTRRVLVCFFVIAMLIVPVSIHVAGTTLLVESAAASEDTVLVPLVNRDSSTAIPVNPFTYYVSITLIRPPGQVLQVPLDEPLRDIAQLQITVLIIYRGSVSSEQIELEYWSETGMVIPLSQDWPQGGLLLIPIINQPDKSYLCIEIEQDWPQHMVPGQLI